MSAGGKETTMKTRVALIGAGGKMGSRICDNLRGEADYELQFCEKGAAGLARLKQRGLEPTPAEQAVAEADLIVLAVPDALMQPVTAELVPTAREGATFVLLDPAAAATGQVALRDGVSFVVCHPCHPAMFREQPTPEARADFFGAVAAEQDIVVALHRGTEDAFLAAERLCKHMFAPVLKAHRVTVEEMAILEPAMAEVVAASAATLMRDAMDEAIRAGVPEPAARAFMLGHAQIALAIAFGAIDSPFSDAAQVAIRWGRERIIKPDWKKVFERDQIEAVIQEMLDPGAAR
jgi:hypothetical protein